MEMGNKDDYKKVNHINNVNRQKVRDVLSNYISN